MDSRKGIIKDELQIKIYLLFVLKRFTQAVSLETVTDIVLDRVSNYFEFIAALSDLVLRGQVEHTEAGYAISSAGAETLSAVESSIPSSIRLHTEEDIEKVKAGLERREAIHAHSEPAEGGCKTTLRLDTDSGRVLSLELLLPGREAARIVERNFRENAESIYRELLKLLTERHDDER